METDQLIAIDLFCTNYNVEYSFVQSLGEAGLIDTIMIQETRYIHIPQLQKLESIIRLHEDLDINLEGIEVVHHLLKRVETMQNEILILKNRLRFFEGN
ncbi:MerR HTH family regulatory protein [Dyadobacter koreensis]|uniref:MerR HTH family regulatory protein n=1 Tax=Dyadobacter koreensis TaxID=408657 RepID=A0A1H6XYI0_9BACT|nr:chaperone modulator CbpM [Dyadobacter koreensis]SEJ34113.1 MerR HTH family regulatory protein [Dyadobacter koreensis]